MTRRGALLLMTVPLLLSAAAGAPAEGAVARAVRLQRRCSTHTARAQRRRPGSCHADARRSTRRRGHGRRPAHHTDAAPHAAAVRDQAGLALAVTIAKVLETPCQNTQLMPEAGNLEAVRVSVLCLINKVRAENGETPLQPNAQLEAAAASHTTEMIADDYFEHVSPSGVTPVARDQASGYIPGPTDGYVIGENLAWGTLTLATPQAIVSAWLASPGHLANILESQYRETGIGVVAEVPAGLAGSAPGATYAQEFGVIIR
jgi:uncharacterized protein YkwD